MPTARIISDQVGSPQFQGQAVRAVGKLLSIEGDQVQLQLAGPDGHPPTVVHCNDAQHKYSLEMVGKGCYEVIGTLQNGSIMEMQTVYMGENFDMGLYSEMVNLTHQFPDIF